MWFLVTTILFVTFAVIPLGVDFLRFMFPYWRLSRIVGKVAHNFLFLTVAGLTLIIIRYHIAVFLPLLLNHESPFSSVRGVLHLLFSSWLWLNILGNYYHTVSIHPGMDMSFRTRRVKFEEAKLASYGIPTTEITPSIAVDGKRLQDELLRSSLSAVRKSRRSELECRTHYCSICHCAIAYWDHHCPFTGNCIGLRNYSHFTICICYCVVGAAYALFITWPHFFFCNVFPFWGDLDDQGRNVCLSLGANSYVFLLVLLGFGTAVWMVFLNVVFLLADVSTSDVLRIKKKHTIFRLLHQRIRAKMFMESDSRLQVLILNRQGSLLWYLLPVRNIHPAVYKTTTLHCVHSS